MQLRVLACTLLVVLAACAKQRPRERWINEVQVRGVKALDEDALLEGLKLQEPAWYCSVPLVGWWILNFGGRTWFDEATLDRDVQRVVGFYAARGHFAARVTRREVRLVEDGRGVDVILDVEEGPPTKLKTVQVKGLDQVPASIRRPIERKLPIAAGQRYDFAKYEEAKQSISNGLKGAGYPYSQVAGKVAVYRGDRTAEVKLAAKPSHRVRLGRTTFVGHGAVPEAKLRNLLRYERGEYYDPDKIDLTREKLIELRVFSSVRLEIPNRPTKTADVKIKLSPAKLRELRLGGGMGIEQQRHELRLSARWTWRNFLGGLRVLSAEVRPAFVAMPALWDMERSGPAVESEIKLVQPDIFGTSITVFGAAGYDVAVREGYRHHGPRTHVGAERFLFSEVLRLGLFLNQQFLDFFDIEQGAFDPRKTPLGLGFTDPYRVSWLEQLVQVDLRDHPRDTRAGFFAEVRLEQGMVPTGSEFRYFKVTPEARAYVPLGTKRLILALRGRFGYLRPADAGDSPVTRRYYLGGPANHRGFGFRRLGPQTWDAENGRWVPLGGNTSLLLSADLRLRVFKLKGSWFNLIGFFDAGDVVPEPPDLALSKLNLAVGGSVLYQTPIGAIRVALGFRLNRLDCVVPAADSGPDDCAVVSGARANADPGERVAFHLTIGEAF